jgi:hypothetical protein
MAVRFGEALHRWGLLHHPTRDVNGFSVYVINVQDVRSTAPRDAYNLIPSPSPGGFKAVLELDRSFEHDLRNPIL